MMSSEYNRWFMPSVLTEWQDKLIGAMSLKRNVLEVLEDRTLSQAVCNERNYLDGEGDYNPPLTGDASEAPADELLC